MAQNDGKYVLVVEGSIPTKDIGALSEDRRQERHRHAPGRRRSTPRRSSPSARAPRGAASLRARQSHRRHRRRLHHQEQAGHQPPGLPAQSVRPAGDRPRIRDHRQTAEARRARPSEVRVRPHHPRSLSAPRALRRRPLRQQFGDDGHRSGWCLYKLGCKGPVTHAPCSTRHFNEVVDCWPIGIGAPCVGCTEKDIAFTVPIFTTADIARPMPPDIYPPIYAEHKGISPVGHRRGGPGRRRADRRGRDRSRKLGRRRQLEPKE